MEAVFDALIKNGNGISVVTVIMLGTIGFVWAISTERLFTGARGKEMQETIKTQAEALKEANKELHETERSLDRTQLLYDFCRERGVDWEAEQNTKRESR